MQPSEPTHPHASRMHVGGKLSFRRRVRSRPSALPQSELPLRHGGEDPPRLEELVPVGTGQVEIEVGPGKGAFLVAAMQARPEAFVLGIEAAVAYAECAAERLAKSGQGNGLLLVDNGKLYLQDRVPDHSVDRIHVYFPDPWPKRRHRGRRFFTEDFVPTLERVLKPGGWLLVATDNAAYAGEICRVLGAAPNLRRVEAEEKRLLEMGPGHGFTPTNFERKYEEEGRVLRRYAWRRSDEG